MVYAFCNTHDVSWGTKGDNTIVKDLGSVVQKGAVVEVELIEHGADMNVIYDKLVDDFRNPAPKPAAGPKVVSQDDYQRSFRTTLVLWWILSNAVLIAIISSDQLKPWLVVTSEDGNLTNYYLTGIFWSVAGLSAVRFIGALGYLLGRLFNSW